MGKRTHGHTHGAYTCARTGMRTHGHPRVHRYMGTHTGTHDRGGHSQRVNPVHPGDTSGPSHRRPCAGLHCPSCANPQGHTREANKVHPEERGAEALQPHSVKTHQNPCPALRWTRGREHTRGWEVAAEKDAQGPRGKLRPREPQGTAEGAGLREEQSWTLAAATGAPASTGPESPTQGKLPRKSQSQKQAQELQGNQKKLPNKHSQHPWGRSAREQEQVGASTKKRARKGGSELKMKPQKLKAEGEKTVSVRCQSWGHHKVTPRGRGEDQAISGPGTQGTIHPEGPPEGRNQSTSASPSGGSLVGTRHVGTQCRARWSHTLASWAGRACAGLRPETPPKRGENQTRTTSRTGG